jgi:ubiquinone/menaquinone biosynthesis C-methylase UbiE
VTTHSIKDYVNRSGSTYSKFDWLDNHHAIKARMRGDLVSDLPILQGDHVVDLGCGTGYWSFLVASRVGPRGRVEAIDADIESIARASEWRNAHVLKDILDFHCADLEMFTPTPNSADVVLLFNTLSYLKDPLGCLERTLPALRPGGRLYIKDTDLQTDFFHPAPIELRASVMQAALAGPAPAKVGNFDPFFAKSLPVLLRRFADYRVVTWSQSFSVFAPATKQERQFICANAAMLSQMAAQNGAGEVADVWFQIFRDDLENPVYDRPDFMYVMNEFVFQLTKT